MPSHCSHLHRRYAAAFLFGLLAFQAAGWLVAWHTARWEARFSAQQALFGKNTPLRNLTLPTTALSALRVGKQEIIYEGRLYDIRSAQSVGDSVRLELYHDRHEEHLYALLGRVISSDGGDPAPAPFQIWLAKWLGTVFLAPEEPPVVRATPQMQVPLRLFAYRLPMPQTVPGVLTPPPDRRVLRG